MIKNWVVLRTLQPTLILAKPSEKPSVINLEHHFFNLIAKSLWTFQNRLASPFWQFSSKAGRQKQEYYKEQMDNLMDIALEKNLHWRHRLSVMKLISIIGTSSAKVYRESCQIYYRRDDPRIHQRTAMSNLTNESTADWSWCFANLQHIMDSNRLLLDARRGSNRNLHAGRLKLCQ